MSRRRSTDQCAASAAWLAVASAVLVAGCATGRHGDRAGEQGAPPSLPFFERDGPDPHPPDGLASVPDAEPRIEPIRSGGPNKPYEALGLAYVPLLDDRPYTERGLATWYGRKFHGHRTSSGEPYDMYAMTAAHPVLPIPSYARVRNPANGREVVVRINDRGPFHSGRVIDLSYTAALKLGVLRGATLVDVQHITGDDIRTGAWRTPALATAAAAATQAKAPIAAAPPSAATATMATPVDVAVLRPPPRSEPAPATMAAAASSVAGSTEPPPIGEGASVLSSPVPAATATLVAIGPTPDLAPPAAPASTANPTSTATPVTTDQAALPTDPAVDRRDVGAAPGWWLQLGAFHQRDAADRLSQDVAAGARWLAPLLAVAADARWFRLQAGPYASVAEARDAAERLRHELRLTAMIVPRR